MKVDLRTEYLLVICYSVLILATVIFIDLTIIRTLLCLPFVLLLPGYLVVAVLFPAAEELEGLERLVLSMGLSIIMVPLVGLLQNYLPWGIKLWPMMLSVTILNMILIWLGWLRRNRITEEKRFLVNFPLSFSKWPEWAARFKESKLLNGSLLTISLFLVFTLLYIVFAPKVGERFTEFYITGQDGKATGYPEQLQVGEYGVVRAVVINNEHQEAIYKVEIKVDGDLIQTISPVILQHAEHWERPVFFKVEKPNEAAKVELLLFRVDQDPKPYRELGLWVKVIPPINTN